MAAIAINVMHQREHVRKQPETAAAPADAPTPVAPFRPLDPDIVSETIPAFFIGRNRQCLWVARDVNGRFGGIFLFESSAVSFARTNSGAAGCATVYLSEPFELDLENRGNPLVPQLRIADPACEAPAGAAGRPHRQDDGAGQTMDEGFLK